MKEIDDMLNAVVRLHGELYLNETDPTIKMRKQFHKVEMKFLELKNELEIMDFMKYGGPTKWNP